MRLYVDVKADRIQGSEDFFRVVNEACELIMGECFGDDWEVTKAGYMSLKPIVTRTGEGTWELNEKRKRANHPDPD